MAPILRAGLVASLFALGCSVNVETPQLTPERMEWQGVDPGGVTMRVHFNAYNPNSFELPLRDLNAHLYLNDQDTGTAVTNLNIALPPRRWVPVTADVRVPWQGVPGMLLTAVTQPVIPYRLEGEVTAERYITVRASFVQQGTVEREFFTRSAGGVLGGAVNAVAPFLQGVQVQTGQ